MVLSINNEFFNCDYEGTDFLINPYIEMKRSQILYKILTKFIQTITHTLGIEIFSIKKNYIRTLTNIFSSWLFVQYSRKDCIKDPIIPSGILIFTTLEETLIDMMKFDKKFKIDERKEIAQSVINKINLQKACDDGITELSDYIKSDYFNKIKDKYNIYKYLKKNFYEKSDTIEYYQIKIQLYEKMNDENIIKIIRSIKISNTVYKKLEKKYNIHKNKFSGINIDILLWCLLFRYITLGSHNHQLAVIPKVMKELNTKLKLNIEAFASGVNHCLDNYCSLFYDIEKYFGSLGSFFNIKPIRGLFGFNPPYENYIMEKGVNNLLKFLDESEINGNELGFLITIPIWDNEGKIIMEKKFNSKPGKNMTIEYEDYTTIKLINDSKYLKFKRMIPKNDFSYLDYFNMIYKDRTIQNTYVILLTNKFMNIDTTILNNISFKHNK